MLLYKPKIERSEYRLRSVPSRSVYKGYRSVMTRQSLRQLYHGLLQTDVILPRFVPIGVYKPIVDSGKTIHWYDVPNDLQIDQEHIRSMKLNPATTIFHYVHQFGIHVPDNVEFIRSLQREGYFIVDDRSLTLPVDKYEEFGDATAYSFYKLIGIPCGGEVRTKEVRTSVINLQDEANRRLIRKMKQNFIFYANPVNALVPSAVFRVFNRAFSRYVEYGHLVDKAFADSLPQLPEPLVQHIDNADFNAVSRRRAEIARMFYNGLSPALLLPLPLESFTRQSMMGFPILSEDPVALLKMLVRRGITTFRFTKIWWWDTSRPFCDLYVRNLLLPAHQGLSDANVRTIIRHVNESVAIIAADRR